MELSHEDVMDNAHSCQLFDYLTKRRYWDPKLGTHVNEAAGVCLKKFKGANYDEARCGYGLNNQPPMRQCLNRMPFPREKEGKLATV